MEILTNTVEINNLVVEVPDTDKRNWKGLQQDNYIPDREDMLRESLNKDYPGLIVDETFDEMMSLITKSKALSKWYVNWKLSYVESLIVPKYFEKYVDKKEYKKSMEKLKIVNSRVAAKSNEYNLAAQNYKKTLSNIEEKYKDIEATTKNDKLLYIATLSSDNLPIKILQMIEKYTPSEGGPTPSQYGREALINYKVALIKKLSENKDLDIVGLVESNLEKF